jgi:transcriptional regulator with XRE-family HTH domain
MSEYDRLALTKERIKEAMKAAGKKQADLVRETGLNRGTISRYLSGEVEPRQDATHKIAVALNVSEMWLWGYDVPKERTPMQKKNDILADIVLQMRRDDELFLVAEKFAKLDAEKRQAVMVVLNAVSTTDK